MKMTKIVNCEMPDCAYNRGGECHAIAITVGSPCAMCDTYLHSAHKGGVIGETAGVGACKMSGCKANVDFECSADEVHVKPHGKHPDCASFKPR